MIITIDFLPRYAQDTCPFIIRQFGESAELCRTDATGLSALLADVRREVLAAKRAAAEAMACPTCGKSEYECDCRWNGEAWEQQT